MSAPSTPVEDTGPHGVIGSSPVSESALDSVDTPVPPEGTDVIPPIPAQLPERLAKFADAMFTLQESAPSASSETPPIVPGYEIVGLLGRGGMGVVYQARHLALRRIVALKMIRTGPEAGPEELIRFRTETEAVAALQHPGIVQIYEVGEHNGRPYCALEFVPGGSLAQHASGRPLAANTTAQLVEGLARAIHCAHEHGIVHRDLKPANVLLAADGTPKVTDFGLAKQLEVEGSHTRTGQLLGTPSYMAPELLAGKVGLAADIYALGAILYELLTGRPPFHGVTPRETLLQAETLDPVPPRSLQPGVPRDLETITLKCLRKEPERRYASAAELAADLARFQAGEPILARPVGAWERGVKWVKRRPTTATLVTTSALALAGLVAGSMWYNARLRSAKEDLTGALGQVTIERDEANRLREEATTAHARAQANLLKAAAISDRLTEVVTRHLSGVPGTKNVRRDLLEEVSKIHLECQRQATENPAIEQIRGRSLMRLGLVYRELDEYVRAEQAHREALDIFTRLHKSDRANDSYLKDLSYGHHNLAMVLQTQAVIRKGRTRTLKDPKKAAEAEQHGRISVELQRTLITRQPDVRNHHVDLAKHLNNLGIVLHGLDRFDEAERAYLEAVAEASPQVAAAPVRHDYRSVLAANHHNLGELYEAWSRLNPAGSDRDLARAAASYRQAVDARRTMADSPTRPRDARADLARSLDNLARAQQALMQFAEAESSLREARDQRQKQVDEFPTIPTYQTDLGGALNNLANLLRDRGRAAEALPLLRQAIRYQEAVYRLNRRDTDVRTFLRNHYGALTETLVALRDHAGAAAAAELLTGMNPKSPSDPYHAARYLARCVTLAGADARLDAAGQDSARAAYSDQALRYLKKAVSNGFKNTPGYIPNQKGRPLDHRDLDPIRNMPDFKRLSASLTTPAKVAGH